MIYGCIGEHLSHSYSAEIHRLIGKEPYELKEIEPENLGSFLREGDFCAVNVTIPYKEAVIPYLDSLDDDARQIGAVNVIRFIRGPKSSDFVELRGYNSDVVGFEKTLPSILTPQRTSAMVLGTGGAAKAVSTALRRNGIDVQLVSRRKSEHTLVYEEITRAMVAEHKLIINATPLGKYPDDHLYPDFPYRFLTKEHLCYDLIYNPEETVFMKKSAQYGAATKNGIEMLLLQAFDSYSIWTS